MGMTGTLARFGGDHWGDYIGKTCGDNRRQRDQLGIKSTVFLVKPLYLPF